MNRAKREAAYRVVALDCYSGISRAYTDDAQNEISHMKVMCRALQDAVLYADMNDSDDGGAQAAIVVLSAHIAKESGLPSCIGTGEYNKALKTLELVQGTGVLPVKQRYHYVVTHTHKYGATNYVVNSPRSLSEMNEDDIALLVEHLDIDFEPEKYESIQIDALEDQPIELPETA